MNQESQDTFTPIKSLLYWRKSKINGFLCVPAILTLDESKTLSLRDAKQNGFSVPLSEATFKFTTWGTMYITIAGKTYDILGMAAALSPSTTKEQDEEIRQAAGRNGSKNAALSSMGAAGTAMSSVSAGAGALGAISTELAYYDGLEAIKVWQEQIVKAGGVATTSKMKGMNYVLIGMAIVAVIVITVVIKMGL